MSDLERAREILAGYPLETAQHVIADALAAARREGAEAARAENAVHIHIAYDNGVQNGKLAGAEEMRERAAQTAGYACIVVPPDGSSPTKDARLLCEEAAHRIRALPLTPEEPT